MQQFYSQFLKKADVCFDVGANVGDRTEVFARLCNLVVAVEPQSKCIAQLNSLFSNNSRVHIVQTALGSEPGVAEMAVSNISTMSSLSKEWMNAAQSSGRFGPEIKWDTTERVNITTLDRLIEQFGSPAFIKVDVEGYELEVLSGLNRPVKYLSFEFVPERLDRVMEILSRLALLGPIEANYALGETMKLILPKWVTAQTLKGELSKLGANTQIFGDVYVHFI
jgi:FkbM family methyltransferase